MIKMYTLKMPFLILVTAVILTGCNGLGLMIKKQNLISYAAQQDQFVRNGDSISVTFSVKYPAKFFAKKAILTITPVIVDNANKELVSLKPFVLGGEKTSVPDRKIRYMVGGTFAYSCKVLYKPEIKGAKVELKASVYTNPAKTMYFKAILMGDGNFVIP